MILYYFNKQHIVLYLVVYWLREISWCTQPLPHYTTGMYDMYLIVSPEWAWYDACHMLV